jgi:FkbM family methyltransferase
MKSILRASVNWLPHGIRHRIKHIPGVAGFQRWLVNRVLSGEPFLHAINSGPAAGLRFEVTLPLDKAIWAGTYEPEFAEAISQGVKDGDVCYDVGGYRGYMSGVMALAGASRVLVFEPLPENQQALQRLSSLNPELNITLEPVAVGNTDGSVRLRVMADASMGKLVISTFQAGATGTGEIDVAIRRLDSLVQAQEIPSPQVIKIDVEGAELCVLLGAAGVLRDSRPLVFIEAHSASLEQACSQELAQLGYRIRRIELNPGGEEKTRHLIASPN